MNILFIGDIYGSLGRDTVKKYIARVKEQYSINYCIANGENAAHGKGITEVIYKEFLEQGINVITMGNHTFDNREIFNFIDNAKNLIRPANLDMSIPGKGYDIYNYNEYKVAIINLLGRTFMMPANDPFRAFDEIYELVRQITPIIIVDLHAEATSEKIAFGYYVDGRATAVIGTHTHVPTADNRILSKQTAYISDVGMTGPLNGVIGVERESVISRFINGLPVKFNPVEEGDAQFNAVVIQVNKSTGKAIKIERINIFDKKIEI
ncbi:MAG: metallophosphoesterase [Haloplasmataceae bacterium]|jgi:metallophosphoesterase (TIGR00282 family)|nr:metallophosphoesterase [Haloplasmataceae bacterium]